MGVETKITCDHCDADLSTGGNQQRRTIVLSDMSRPVNFDFPVTAMMIEPLGPYYFCGLRCLSHWLEKRIGK